MSEEKQPGPEAETLKLTGKWQERLKEAVQKPKPKRGWPKPKKKAKGKK